MARHHISEPRVKRVVERLVHEFLRWGSVNALAEALSGAPDTPDIYPNRIHGLLSDDPARSVNSATLDALERALDYVGADSTGREENAELHRDIRRAYAASQALQELSVDEAVRKTSDDVTVPPAVVRSVIRLGAAKTSQDRTSRQARPDWSWQDTAVRRCLYSLRKQVGYKAGLVVPTGGGKTRIALRVILQWLADEDRRDTKVLWATHRKRLRQQAHRALQDLLRNPGQVPEDSPRYVAERIEFGLIRSGASDVIDEYGSEGLTLVVIDEAHHAAAPSYQRLLDLDVPGLFLTATPNRADNLPIGIDEIAYTITYRELFRRGCVIDPEFLPPETMPFLNWDHPQGLLNLADFLLDRSESQFRKLLVAVTRTERTETLHEALLELLDSRPEHPLGSDDVAFVHGRGNSSGSKSTADFLDEFSARRRGILVGTSQLLGEGFDDPLLDTAVITYPSESISHLMQVAGRVMRVAPDKEHAFVVQVRESNLQYHFEHRWLYQDISDRLRPELLDLEYESPEDLRCKLESTLRDNRVDGGEWPRTMGAIEELEPGAEVSVMFTGQPYYGRPDDFNETADWNAIVVTPAERERFIRIFNSVSDLDREVRRQASFLSRWVQRDERRGSLFKAYMDLLFAVGGARGELGLGERYPNQDNRPYRPGLATTWLRYVTFRFRPQVPEELRSFLEDAVNREETAAAYIADPTRWQSAAKIELPLQGSLAVLLDKSQTHWFGEMRSELAARIVATDDLTGYTEVARWKSELGPVPVPFVIVDHMDQLLRPERLRVQYIEI